MLAAVTGTAKHPGWLIALNVLFALLFLVSAGLQYNDPDPLRWVALYGGAAVVTVLALHTRRGWIGTLAVGAIAALWAAWLWQGLVGYVELSDLWLKMSEKGGKVEEMREAGGLSIVVGWLAVASRAGWRAAPAA